MRDSPSRSRLWSGAGRPPLPNSFPEYGFPPYLLDRDPMWACWTGGESCVEIELEPRIEFQAIVLHSGHVDSVVALGVHVAEVVFVEEVVADHQPLLIPRQRDVMRPRALTQVERLNQARLLRIFYALRSARISALKKYLTGDDMSEMGIFRQQSESVDRFAQDSGGKRNEAPSMLSFISLARKMAMPPWRHPIL